MLLAALAIAGGWFAINSWLKAGNLDASIKATLSEAIGAPVEFESLGFVPFTRVAVRRITVANPEVQGAAPLVTCKQIELGFSPRELIQRRLRFERLGIDAPDVRLIQDAAGKYRLPAARGAKPATTDRAPVKESGTAKAKAPEQEWVIDVFQINGGRIEGIGADGKRLWLAEDVGVKAKVGKTGGDVSAKGDAAIGRAHLIKNFKLSDLTTPFSFSKDTLTLPGLDFVCYGGSGSAKVTFDAGRSAFQATIDAGGIDASSAIEAFGAEPSTVSGKISLHAEVAGADAISAKGTFSVEPAKLAGSNVLRTLGTLLMLPELANSQFGAVRGQFNVAGDRIVFSDLRTEPRERLQILATGSIGFAGDLDLKGTLAAKSETLNLAPLLARAGGTQSADGFTEVPFEVKGTTEQPKVSVAPSAVGNVVGGFLQRLIGGQKQKKSQGGTGQQPEPTQEPEKPADALKRLIPIGR